MVERKSNTTPIQVCKTIEKNRIQFKVNFFLKGTFEIKVSKQTPGEFFPDLEMLTKLLAPKETSELNAPCIEELGESTGCPDEDEADEFDWQIEQELIPEEVNVTGPRYGFAKSKQNVFSSLRV